MALVSLRFLSKPEICVACYAPLSFLKLKLAPVSWQLVWSCSPELLVSKLLPMAPCEPCVFGRGQMAPFTLKLLLLRSWFLVAPPELRFGSVVLCSRWAPYWKWNWLPWLLNCFCCAQVVVSRFYFNTYSFKPLFCNLRFFFQCPSKVFFFVLFAFIFWLAFILLSIIQVDLAVGPAPFEINKVFLFISLFVVS